ncbi:MAG: GNAT family N-acetyltransferase [Planctomycetaceae bacterium]|nr:GNAT family N-acetyltransferase [Planctomycetaceae bacterium]
MTDITVRNATAVDWPTIVEFNRRLALETESLALDGPTLEAGVKVALADATKARYFVACAADGQIVGQMMHTYEWSDWRNGDIWWLQSVYVLPDYRNQGVFRRLFEFVAERARADSRVVGLRLYVEDHNERAQAVYERLGLKAAGYGVMEAVWRRAPARV